VPIYRQPNGRHRRSRKSHGTPFTAAALGVALATVGGLSLSRADAVVSAGTNTVAAPDLVPDTNTARAEALQQRTAAAAAARASRSRASAAAADVARRQAAERARLERERKAAAERAARLRELNRWVVPVTHYRLTAYFGQAGGLWSTVHTGQDFAAPYGTSVKATHRGEIVFAGWDGAYGRKIVIQHEDGTETWYCHLSSFIRTTGFVTTGELIGRIGSTGNTTGPHLHLEVRINGVAVNPLTYLRRKGVDV
jgi:murein DD-endopeptidase MepM/ murein hydrolase activator NlpD